MQMAETRRRMGAHHIDIALAAGIEEMRAGAPSQDNRQRRVISRAKAGFPCDDSLRGNGGLQGHGGLRRHENLSHESWRSCPGSWPVFAQNIRDKASSARKNAWVRFALGQTPDMAEPRKFRRQASE